MGLGNGISAGVVMTLGADAAPPADRAQFIGGWRLCNDLGSAAGPLVIGAVSAVRRSRRLGHHGPDLGRIGLVDQVASGVRTDR